MSIALYKTAADIASVYLCHSCGACSAVCPHGAIAYRESVGGYLFPSVDKEVCTLCGLCVQVCPGISFGKSLHESVPEDPFRGRVLSCHAGKAADPELFKNGQSGGAASALVRFLLDTGTASAVLVTGMSRETPPRPRAKLLTAADDLAASQKSKYLPVPLLGTVPELLKIDGTVAVVGLSCHIHAFKNMMDLNRPLAKKSLIFIGLICESVMLASAVDFFARKAGEKRPASLVFKDKNRPSYPGNPVVEGESGRLRELSGELRMRMKEYFTPLRCRLCFDKMNVFADIVCGDPHKLPGIDRKGGETLVISRTPAGLDLVNKAIKAGAVSLREADAERAFAGQGMVKKQRQWAAFMASWKAAGHQVPHYPVGFEEGQANGKSKELLEKALGMDSFSNRKKLVNYYSKKMLLKNLRKVFHAR